VKEYQRKQLLERVDREGATVGAAIPETIEVQGETVDLREFVFEIKRRETVPKGERERVETAKRNLRRERLERFQRLESGEMPYEEGEALVDAIVGLDRALEALESLGPADLERERQAQAAADNKRWMSFLKKALGHDDGDTGRATTKPVKLTPEIHARLKAHAREGETLSGAVGRALDALEREAALPDAVTAALREEGEV